MKAKTKEAVKRIIDSFANPPTAQGIEKYLEHELFMNRLDETAWLHGIISRTYQENKLLQEIICNQRKELRRLNEREKET